MPTLSAQRLALSNEYNDLDVRNIVETMKQILIDRVRKQGKRICIECKSTDIEYYDRVYIDRELFPFPYCKKCGLVQWHSMSGYHLTLEKLYELYMKLADEFGFSKEETLSGLEYIKENKGDKGYSDDVEILKTLFDVAFQKKCLEKICN